jgi:hypothetical protein
MSDEAYSAAHAKIAQDILGRALKELMAGGLGEVEACHALIHMGMDTMPAFACPCCLADEWVAVIAALEDRLEKLAPAEAVH